MFVEQSKSCLLSDRLVLESVAQMFGSGSASAFGSGRKVVCSLYFLCYRDQTFYMDGNVLDDDFDRGRMELFCYGSSPLLHCSSSSPFFLHERKA